MVHEHLVPPESKKGNHERSSLWSLGSILYKCAKGQCSLVVGLLVPVVGLFADHALVYNLVCTLVSTFSTFLKMEIGEYPFMEIPSETERLRRYFSGPPPSLDWLNVQNAPFLHHVLVGCLRTKPEDR